MHALSTLSYCQLQLACVYVCAAKHRVRDCEWKRVWISVKEQGLLMKTLITAERLFPSHCFANLSLISNLALSVSLSFSPPPSLTKTHLQSVGAKNQLVTPPSHYDNWVLWESWKTRKHIHTSSAACWPSFSLSHTCTDSFHSRANVTRLNADIHSDQMVLCSSRDGVVLYVLSFSLVFVTSGFKFCFS